MNSFYWISVRVISMVLLAGSTAMLVSTTGCGRSHSTGPAVPDPAGPATTSASAASGPTTHASAAGPLDMCGIVTPGDATALLGPLPLQPPAKTESVGFGIYQCMYVGPKRSGGGAQTVFSHLTVAAGTGKDAADLLQNEAEKRHAVVDFSGLGEGAKRSADGSFVWAKQGALSCTAQISNGLPPALTADSATTQLAGLCRKVFSNGKR